MKHFFSILAFVLFVNFGYGQNITYDGTITDMDSQKSISGVTVTVLSGGLNVTSSTTSGGGKYSVNFPVGKKYTVKYTKSGYVTKIIELDVTSVIAEDMPPGGKIFPPINLDLFQKRPGYDFSFLETTPVVKWYLDGDRMNYNNGQMMQTKKKIENLLLEAESALKNADAEYNKLIKDADKLFDEGKLEEALNKYVAALQLPGKQKEAHPNARLLEIEELLQKKEEEELAFQQDNQAYLNLIAAADNFAKAKEYDKAISKYEEAIVIKDDEQYPKDRIATLNAEKEKAKKQAEYDKLIKRADGFFKQNSVQAARDMYQNALKILPNEEYPKSQLEIIKGKLDEQKAIKEKKDNYNKAVAEADKLFDAGNFEEAIVKYEEALTFESAATYPPGRIKMAKEEISKAKSQEEFNKLVTEADAHISAKEYQPAIDKYTQAIALMESPEVQTKLDNAKSLLEEQKNKEQQAQQIADLLTAAKEKVSAEDYSGAINDFDAVLAIDETNTEAKTGKENAAALLEEKKVSQEKQAKFEELVAAADQAFEAKTWEEAKTKYVEAQGVFDDNEHVNNRITEVESKIAEAQKSEQIDGLLASAKEKLTAEDFSGAITDFDAVLAIEETNAEAIKGKENAETLLVEKNANQEKESQFNELVTTADQAFDNAEWEKAKEKYLEAKALFDDNKHVNERIEAVETALSKVAEQEANSAEIQALLDEAEALKPENKWSEVISKYESALAIDEERTDVSDMLEAAKASKAEYEAQQAKAESSEQIQALIDEAEALKPENKWSEVISKYESALAIDEERTDVSEMLEAAKASKAEFEAQQAKAESSEQIQALLDEAEALKPENKWSEVISKYESALAIDEERTDVSEMLEAAKASKAEFEAQQAKAESSEQIQALLDEAEALKPENKWSEVISKYESALAIDEGRTDVSEMLEAAKASKAEYEAQQSEKEAKAEFNSLVSAADEAFDAENWNKAKEKYSAAKAINDGDEHVNNRIEKIEEQLALQSENAEKNAEIQALLDEAEALKPENKWSDVIAKYEKALKIDESRTDVEEKLTAAKASKEAFETAQNQSEEFEALKEDGNKLFDKEKWENAQAKYEEALKIQTDSEIEANMNVIKEKLAAIQANKQAEINAEKYDEEIQLAASAVKEEKFEEAITHLKTAKNLKPSETFPQEEIDRVQSILDKVNAKDQLEENYKKAIANADKAFNSGDYKESIVLYNEALSYKAEEEYPKAQILKVDQAITENASNQVEEEYNNFISAGDTEFVNKNYEKALANYKSALEIKEEDSKAKDKIDETQQILDNLAEAKRKQESQEEMFDEYIAEADQLFKDESYQQAKSAYQKALSIKSDDAYAKEQLSKSIQKASEELAKKQDLRYKQSIKIADEYFNNEEYEKAITAYKSASNLKSTSQYPKTQIAKAQQKLAALIKEKGGLENLGEKSNISILEGAALLQEGEIERERLKQAAVANRLSKFEGEDAQRELSDYDERVEFNNEVKAIADLRDQSQLKEEENKGELAQKVDDQIYTFEKKTNQLTKYKDGELSRSSQEIEYVKDDFDVEKADYRAKHKDAIEELKAIESERNIMTKTESKHHHVKVTATGEEIDEIENGQNPVEDSRTEYEDVIRLQDEAILAEIKVAESSQEKGAIQQQMKEDLLAYEMTLEKKYENEASTVHGVSVEIDEQITAYENQYDKTTLGKDDARQRAVEQLKEMDQSQQVQNLERSKEKEDRTEEIYLEVEGIKTENTERSIKNTKDLTVVEKDVKERIDNYEEKNRNKRQREVEENRNTGSYIDDIENNKINFTEAIANELGEDFPEGVTQENYIRKDSKGIPVKIVTRRIVVVDGRGEVYIRTQTRNGLTYSKNGSPVTEQNWINGTEDANLEKHY
ncbi:hypothetical protein [Brumimicrobium aurantiacum]|uniref:Tetratricopeptide repeat protein n=1 Tax=Brumimicrobium aurantiacum TaxID=1737063 RepID=A0A3E1F072_9FLAO|nr:hypothetical protein [Brumimicrobium aurantiacum]RFC55205.1 hypothetical protein DXU93_05120 [Brumimicrobium aurantiacum]